jgi:VWFA-related protein
VRISNLAVILAPVALLAGSFWLQGQQSTPAGNPSASQDPQATPSVPTFRAVARSVVLDIAVVDSGGHSVKGLQEGDFTILEDGAPQVLQSFEEHNDGTPSKLESPPKLPANTFTNSVARPNSNASTIILLDALDTSIQAQMYAYEQVVNYIKHAPPGASMALFQLDDGMHLVQDFSSDPQVLLDAVESKRSHPRLGFCAGMPDCQRRRHDILVAGMRELGRYLSGIPGRKNLVWFIGTVPHEIYGVGIGNPFRDSFSFVDDLSQTSDLLTLSRVAVFPIDVRGLIAPTGGANSHIGLRVAYEDDSLVQVAEATGGKAFLSTNGVKDAIAEVVDTGSNYYTVSYTPTNDNWNGEFRQIKVELDQRGYSLEYRHGYVARNREGQEQRHVDKVQRKQSSGRFVPTSGPAAPAPSAPHGDLHAAMSFAAIPSTELIFTASLAPSAAVEKIGKKATPPPDNYLSPDFLSKPFREYNVLYAIDIRKIGLNQTPDGVRHGQLDFVAVLYDDRGEVVNSLISTAILDLTDPTYRHLAQNGFSISQPIAIPVKGNYFLRLGIRDAVGERVGAMQIPVDEIKLGVAGAGQTLAP